MCVCVCALCSVEKESEEFCPGATDSLSQLNCQMVMLMMMMSCSMVDPVVVPKVEYFCSMVSSHLLTLSQLIIDGMSGS